MSAIGLSCLEAAEKKHCLHELPLTSVYAPALVCCWCGDIFVMPEGDDTHGEFKPKLESKR